MTMGIGTQKILKEAWGLGLGPSAAANYAGCSVQTARAYFKQFRTERKIEYLVRDLGPERLEALFAVIKAFKDPN